MLISYTLYDKTCLGSDYNYGWLVFDCRSTVVRRHSQSNGSRTSSNKIRIVFVITALTSHV